MHTSLEAGTFTSQPSCAPTSESLGYRIPGRCARMGRAVSVGADQKQSHLLHPNALASFEVTFPPLFHLPCPRLRSPHERPKTRESRACPSHLHQQSPGPPFLRSSPAAELSLSPGRPARPACPPLAAAKCRRAAGPDSCSPGCVHHVLGAR